MRGCCLRRELQESTRTLVLRPLVALPGAAGAAESVVIRPLLTFKALVFAIPNSFPAQFDVMLLDCEPWVQRAKAAKVGRFADS